ncbi:MAG TPA: hypothetical protein VF768_11345, partial [Holophagaceae bacterium]
YAHYSSRHQSITGDSSGTTGYPYNASYREWAFGVGLFWQKQMPERTSVYLGPRIGYVSEKNDINAYSVISSNDTHGFEVIPTLGFEFFPVKHLSLGGEVGYRFIQVRSSTSFVPYTPGYGPSDIRSQETVSTFLVRYSF